MQFGWLGILLIIVAIVLLFGASRLPQLARSIGQSRKAFKEGLRAEEDESAPTGRIESASTESNLSSLSDEEILAEIQRRSKTKS